VLGALCLRLVLGRCPLVENFTRANKVRRTKNKARLCLRKLLQKPNVVLEKEPNIVKRVHECAHPIDSETERETRKLLWVDSHAAKHVRMHHAGAAQLNPAGVFTYATAGSITLEATEIKLCTRLRERKVRRAKA